MGNKVLLPLTIFPLLVSLFSLRKGATTEPYLSSVFISLSAVNFSYVTLRLIEPNDDGLHLLTWHYSPMIVMVLICALIEFMRRRGVENGCVTRPDATRLKVQSFSFWLTFRSNSCHVTDVSQSDHRNHNLLLQSDT